MPSPEPDAASPEELPFPGFDPVLAPTGRPWRAAAVLFLLYPRDGIVHTVFTRRTATVSSHRGQISLPGGRYEASDPSLWHTALREAHEELGIAPGDVQLVAELALEYVGISAFRVTPFVGQLTYAPVFTPDPREVEEVIEVPLALLCDPATYREAEHQRVTFVARGPVYQCGPHEIWGATARMLQRILAEPTLGPLLAVPE